MNSLYFPQRSETCSALSKKAPNPPHSPNDEPEFGATANIIFNLAHLGISIDDAKYFDLESYFELVQLEMKVIGGKGSARKANQTDIDWFFS